MKHFLAIADCSPDELRHVLDVAARLKKQLKQSGRNDPILAGKSLAMVFEKPSLRTRVSFAVGMNQLGGHALLLSRDEVGLGVREPVQDVARVLSGMCDGIMARVFAHQTILDLAKSSAVPVINGLSDYNHPCQALADIMSIQEQLGELKGRTIAFIGDGNNVARSLAVACGKLEMKFILATPQGYEFSDDDARDIKRTVPGLDYRMTRDPLHAVRSADVLYTDTWVSMGQEAEKAKRIKQFEGFQINANLLSAAPKHAIVLHCLPAYRDLEITDDVIEGPQSHVFEQAENRLHAQKGLLAVLMSGL